MFMKLSVGCVVVLGGLPNSLTFQHLCRLQSQSTQLAVYRQGVKSENLYFGLALKDVYHTHSFLKNCGLCSF
jgi:hypothetical protein